MLWSSWWLVHVQSFWSHVLPCSPGEQSFLLSWKLISGVALTHFLINGLQKQLWKQSTTLQGSHDRPFPGTPQGKRRGEKQGERKNKENGGPGQRRRFRGEKKGRGNEKGVKERKRNGGREGAAIIRSFVTGATPSLCVCNTIWANCIALTLGTLLSVSEAFSNFPP